MHVLVTGGAGYLGSVLSEALLDAGHRVTVLDNLMFGQTSLFHLCHRVGFEFVRGDARDESTLSGVLANADAIVPLAALVGAPLCDGDPHAARTTNLDAIKLLGRLRSPRQLVLFPTTNSGYGTTTGEVHCTEDSALDPISLYGRTKVDAERVLLDAENTMTFRLATVFGMSPRMRIDLLVNHFVHAAATDGYLVVFEKDFKRNYIHIRDVADCFLHGMAHAEAMVGRPYNAGLDEANLSKAELAEQIRRHRPEFFVHYAEIGSDPDKRNYVVSNRRLRDAGFVAQRSIDTGIGELLRGYRMMGRGRFGNV